MEKQVLLSGYKEKVVKDDELKVAIAKAMGRRMSAIDRWLREDDVKLTTVTVLNLIRSWYSIPATESLTEAKQVEHADQGCN